MVGYARASLEKVVRAFLEQVRAFPGPSLCSVVGAFFLMPRITNLRTDEVLTSSRLLPKDFFDARSSKCESRTFAEQFLPLSIVKKVSQSGRHICMF